MPKEKKFAPMRAPSEAVRPDDLKTLEGHWYASPKIDGIRCVVHEGKALARSLKPIPNKYIQSVLRLLPPLDGELLLRYKGKPVPFEDVTSAVMSQDGEPDFIYWVFDITSRPNMPFVERYAHARVIVRDHDPHHIKILDHIAVTGPRELKAIYATFSDAGYEGMMIRRPEGRYKYGTATRREEFLVKVKGCHREEGVVVGFERELENTNAAVRNKLGLLERSTKKAGKVPKDMVGKLICRWNERLIKVSGFKEPLARDMFLHPEKYRSKLVTFEFQELTKDGLPRFPQFKGFRDVIDL